MSKFSFAQNHIVTITYSPEEQKVTATNQETGQSLSIENVTIAEGESYYPCAILSNEGEDVEFLPQ